MKITQDVREYAAQKEIDDQAALFKALLRGIFRFLTENGASKTSIPTSQWPASECHNQ
jgi:hypothetical protein